MAFQTIRIKNTNVPGNVPGADKLDTAELCLNLKDHTLFSKDADGAVFQVAGDGGGATGDYVKLDDEGSLQKIEGGGGLDVVSPITSYGLVSQPWTSASSYDTFVATNYDVPTFKVDAMGDVYVRRSLVIGNDTSVSGDAVDGTLEVIGKATSHSTDAGDSDETLATKGYVDSVAGGGGGVTGDYVKLDDEGTVQTITGGGGLDVVGPVDIESNLDVATKVRVNSDNFSPREGVAINGDIAFNSANYALRFHGSDNWQGTTYTFMQTSAGSTNFELRKAGGWGPFTYMYIDTSHRIHLSNTNNSGSPDVIGTTTAMVHAHGGLNAEFGTDTAQLGNVAPMNDWSCYPARA